MIAELFGILFDGVTHPLVFRPLLVLWVAFTAFGAWLIQVGRVQAKNLTVVQLVFGVGVFKGVQWLVKNFDQARTILMWIVSLSGAVIIVLLVWRGDWTMRQDIAKFGSLGALFGCVGLWMYFGNELEPTVEGVKTFKAEKREERTIDDSVRTVNGGHATTGKPTRTKSGLIKAPLAHDNPLADVQRRASDGLVGANINQRSDMGVQSAKVRRTGPEGSAEILIRPADAPDYLAQSFVYPWREAPYHPGKTAPKATDPVPILMNEDGDMMSVKPRVPLICGGTMGAGKTETIQQLIRGMAVRENVCLVICDPKGEDMPVWAARAGILAIGLHSTLHAVDLVAREMNRRVTTGTQLGEYGGGAFVATKEMPLIVLIVDEFNDISDHLGGAGSKKYATFGTITRMGRSKGIWPSYWTQRLSASAIPQRLRNLAPNQIGLKVARKSEVPHIFEDDPECPLWQIDESQPGRCFASLDGYGTGKFEGRVFYEPQPETKLGEIATATAHLRVPLPAAPNVHILRDGIPDEDGEVPVISSSFSPQPQAS